VFRMMVFRMMATATAVGTVAAFGAGTAGAERDLAPLNGVYRAVSDGFWAKSNETRRAEAVVVATWTISSTCTTYIDCTGTVTSDQGWSADLIRRGWRWSAKHIVPHWIPCPDGTFYDAEQTFTFWAKRGDAPDDTDNLTGWDTTLGPSGACGVNRNLEIRMPFTLTRIG
jgi:hypothetical protein